MHRSLAALLVVMAAPSAAQAAPPATAVALSPFTFEEIMVPMRDGAKLQTIVLRPRDARGPLPVLFQRSPYGVPDAAPATMPRNWVRLALRGGPPPRERGGSRISAASRS